MTFLTYFGAAMGDMESCGYFQSPGKKMLCPVPVEPGSAIPNRASATLWPSIIIPLSSVTMNENWLHLTGFFEPLSMLSVKEATTSGRFALDDGVFHLTNSGGAVSGTT